MPDAASQADELIQCFYGALAAGDAMTASSLYATDAHFSDPVFTDLHGDEPGAMWRMFAARSSDLQIELLEHSGEGDRGRARWRARYTFSQTGRPVVNDIRSTFVLRDGVIADQRDEFDFYRWARMALGRSGLLLGWSPRVRTAVQRGARAALNEYIAQERSAGDGSPAGGDGAPAGIGRPGS